MRQRKALLALAMLMALLTTFSVEVQAKGGRSGGGGRSSGRSGGHSGGGHGFFSGWGSSKSKSKSSSSSDSSSSSGGGFFSNWFWGGKSKSSSPSTSHKSSGSSHSSESKPGYKHNYEQDISKDHNGGHNSHLHHSIKPSSVGHANHGNPPPPYRLHAINYPRQPVFMSSSIPGAPPPPPPPYGGYYASSSSLPVGATFYPQVPRKSSDPGFGSGFFAGAYYQSILNRLSHVHYYGGHRSVIHNHNNENYNDNNGAKDRIIIINNNPMTTGDLEEPKTTIMPPELGYPSIFQFDQTQPMLTNNIADTTNSITEVNAANLPELMPESTSTLIRDGVVGNATTMSTTFSDTNSTANSDDFANNAINTAATPAGGIICFPSIVNETDAQDSSKVLQVEKIFCFPAEPPASIVEEWETMQHQPPAQPNILKEDEQYLDIAIYSGSNKKGIFKISGISVSLLLLSLY